MQGVSVTKALGAGIAALVAMFALWGALFAVQPAFAADAADLAAGDVQLGTAIQAPATAEVVIGYTTKVTATIKSEDKSGTWEWKASNSKATIASGATSDTVTIKGVDCGDVTLTATYTLASGASDKATVNVKVKGAKKGQTVAADGIKYKVTSKNTAMVVGTTKAGKKKTSVTVPKAANLAGNGKKAYTAPYKVTEIKSYGLHKLKKVKTIVVGDNVVKIGNHAFCSGNSLTKLVIGKKVKTIGKCVLHTKAGKKIVTNKIKTITIKSTKLTKVTNMLKLNKSVTKVKVPASKKAKYQKLFKKCGKKGVKVVS